MAEVTRSLVTFTAVVAERPPRFLLLQFSSGRWSRHRHSTIITVYPVSVCVALSTAMSRMCRVLCCNRNMYEKHILLVHWEIVFRPRAFPRALGCLARRGAACTLRSKFGPRPGSVARTLCVQVVQAGSFSRDCCPRRRAPQDHGNTTTSA